jgi:DedD protein
MEKKKLLLVSVSTGIFLILVLGASILIFSPRTISARTAIPPGNSGTGALSNLPQAVKEDAAKPEESAPDGAPNGVPTVSFIPEPAPVAIEAAVAEAPVAKPAVVQKPAAKPAAAQKPVTAYWVQIGSYTVKSGADKVKANLAERGLVSVIFDNEVQGKIYYRVRVGPYVSQAEADYWLKLVRAMDGYEKSLVWKSGA